MIPFQADLTSANEQVYSMYIDVQDWNCDFYYGVHICGVTVFLRKVKKLTTERELGDKKRRLKTETQLPKKVHRQIN